MTDISIPAGALEAGIAKLPHNVAREELRAAFLAMVGNWPNMQRRIHIEQALILPLEPARDGK